MLYPPEINRKHWQVQFNCENAQEEYTTILCIDIATNRCKYTHQTELAKEERSVIIFGENSLKVIKCSA